MKALTSKDMETVRRTPLFAELPESVLGRVVEISRMAEHPRGKLLFLRREAANRFFSHPRRLDQDVP
jgi:hypothetical protein